MVLVFGSGLSPKSQNDSALQRQVYRCLYEEYDNDIFIYVTAGDSIYFTVDRLIFSNKNCKVIVFLNYLYIELLPLEPET